MSPFWRVVWRVYDRRVLVRVLPARVAPWLFREDDRLQGGQA